MYSVKNIFILAATVASLAACSPQARTNTELAAKKAAEAAKTSKASGNGPLEASKTPALVFTPVPSVQPMKNLKVGDRIQVLENISVDKKLVLANYVVFASDGVQISSDDYHTNDVAGRKFCSATFLSGSTTTTAKSLSIPAGFYTVTSISQTVDAEFYIRIGVSNGAPTGGEIVSFDVRNNQLFNSGDVNVKEFSEGCFGKKVLVEEQETPVCEGEECS